MTIILAIDPGISGALAFYACFPGVSDLHNVVDMPLLDGDVNPHLLREIIQQMSPNVAVIEHVHPHPNEGVSSVWRFASAYTTARVVVALLDIPTIFVSPAKWKRAMGIRGGMLGKEHARRLAIEKFPSKATLFSRKKDHGRAEAALLAVYVTTTPVYRNNHEVNDAHHLRTS
jgi:hypothetical protein